MCAAQAFFTASANNSKKRKLKIKDIFDADKARKEVDSIDKVKEPRLHLDRYRKAQQAMKNYKT